MGQGKGTAAPLPLAPIPRVGNTLPPLRSGSFLLTNPADNRNASVASLR
jgi:hypothetical protein